MATKERRTYRAIREPQTPEESSTELEFLLDTLRKHQKNKEQILDPIFYKRAKMYHDYFDFDHTYPGDDEYNSLLADMKTVSEKIVKNKPTVPQLYIVFFESMLKVAPAQKVCENCKCKFHPVEEDRKVCVYCM